MQVGESETVRLHKYWCEKRRGFARLRLARSGQHLYTTLEDLEDLFFFPEISFGQTVSFSGNGYYLASGSRDGVVKWGSPASPCRVAESLLCRLVLGCGTCENR